MTATLDLATFATALIALVTLCGFIYQIARGFTIKLDTVSKTLALAIDNAKIENALRIEKLEASESGKRHDERSAFQASVLKIENELNRLQRETVRKEELASLEIRMNNMLAKIESKLDAITDRMADWKVIEAKLKGLTDQFDKIVTKLYDNSEHDRK